MHVTDRMARYTPPKPQSTKLPPEEDTMPKPKPCAAPPRTITQHHPDGTTTSVEAALPWQP